MKNKKEMKQKRYKSVEILEAKGINRIVCANLLVKLERSIDYCRLRISTWPESLFSSLFVYD